MSYNWSGFQKQTNTTPGVFSSHDAADGTPSARVLPIQVAAHTWYIYIHRRFIYKGDTSQHAEGTDPSGGLSERARVRRHYGPLCSALVAANSGSLLCNDQYTRPITGPGSKTNKQQSRRDYISTMPRMSSSTRVLPFQGTTSYIHLLYLCKYVFVYIYMFIYINIC